MLILYFSDTPPYLLAFWR